MSNDPYRPLYVDRELPPRPLETQRRVGLATALSRHYEQSMLEAAVRDALSAASEWGIGRCMDREIWRLRVASRAADGTEVVKRSEISESLALSSEPNALAREVIRLDRTLWDALWDHAVSGDLLCQEVSGP